MNAKPTHRGLELSCRFPTACLALAIALGLGSAASAAQASAKPARTESESAKVDPLDWPHWRGPEFNGISREKGLVDRWSTDGEKQSATSG